MMLLPAFTSRPPTLPNAERIRPGMLEKKPTTPFHAFCAPCAAFWKNAPILPGNDWKKPIMLFTQLPMNAVNWLQMLRPVSVWVKNHTSAATNAPMAVTTIMIGFAFMATFNAHCATSAAVAAMLKPCNAATTALMALATLNAASPPPMATSAPAMGSAFALTQSPNWVSLSATAWMIPAAPLNASPNCVPMLPASDKPCSPGAIVVAMSKNAWPIEPSAPPTAFTVSVRDWNASVLLMESVNCFNPPVAFAAKSLTLSAASVSAPVTVGLNRLNASVSPPVMAASRLPNAPSMVFVLDAASLATSLMPKSMMALLNSSADISPFSIASRKLPVYAPFLSMASWSLPEAPGMASANWFQFSVVSLPAPAVWVSIIATLLNVSALPPATAFRLPAASVKPV